MHENIPRSHLESEFVRLRKQLEKWLAKLKLFSPDYALSALYGSQESADVFPLGELSNALLDPRCLLSKSLVKLGSGEKASIPENLPVWSELLHGIQEQHPAFAQTFIHAVLDKLAQDSHVEVEHRATMVSWARWFALRLMKDPVELATSISALLGRQISSESEVEMLVTLISNILLIDLPF